MVVELITAGTRQVAAAGDNELRKQRSQMIEKGAPRTQERLEWISGPGRAQFSACFAFRGFCRLECVGVSRYLQMDGQPINQPN